MNMHTLHLSISCTDCNSCNALFHHVISQSGCQPGQVNRIIVHRAKTVHGGAAPNLRHFGVFQAKNHPGKAPLLKPLLSSRL